MYYAENGSYPATFDSSTGQSTGSTPSVLYACLGTGYTALSNFAQDACYIKNGTTMATKNPSVDSSFARYIASQPSVEGTGIYSLTSDGLAETMRGILYFAYNTGGNSTAFLQYASKGGSSGCGRGGTMTIDTGEASGITACGIQYFNGKPTKLGQ